MLSTLRIKNLALVADLTPELQPGYNVITGETGAGKSILIGALNLVLGERADRTLIRTGARSVDMARLRPRDGRIERALEHGAQQQPAVPCRIVTVVLDLDRVDGRPGSVLDQWLGRHLPHERLLDVTQPDGGAGATGQGPSRRIGLRREARAR